ncbi:MAG: DUF1844 domain-containing protein [Deltaproteobacteria bacterium]|nr:MAG: DUF1844 domain-containing protein [Deltaproteobacteria bacterium]
MGEERVEEKKGFKVVDKRFFARKEENAQKEETRSQESIPKITFSSFIYSLSTTCLMHLGEIPEPTTKQIQKNLPMAKQTIDLLEILAEKTKGNLTPEEDGLLKSLLTELRIRYIKAISQT